MPGRKRLLAAKVVEWIVLALIPILSAVRIRYPLAPRIPKIFIEFTHDLFLQWFVIIIICLSIFGILAKIVQEFLNQESKVRLKAAADAMLDVYFTGIPESERYFNRVTLFKANRGRTQLNPLIRSGTQYHRGIQPFLVNDNDEAKNEGVGGRAWFCNATITVTDLPDCPNSWSNDNPACKEYAEKGFLSPSKAEGLHVKSRSVVATPIRNFQGEKWGVLVLDSRRPDGIDRAKEPLVISFVAPLGKML